MNTCIEHDFSQVATIHVFRKAYTEVEMPIYCNDPRIPSVSSDYGYSYKLKYDRESVKCMDKQQRSVGAYVHTVTLSWEQDAATEDDYNMLLSMRQHPHEVLITYFGGQRRFVRTDATAYAFDYDIDNGTCKCQLTLVSGQGLCMVDTMQMVASVDLSGSNWSKYMILKDGKWTTNENSYHIAVPIPSGFSKLVVSANHDMGISFLSRYEKPNGVYKDANVVSGGLHVPITDKGKTELNIPYTASYVVINVSEVKSSGESSNYIPDKAYFTRN